MSSIHGVEDTSNLVEIITVEYDPEAEGEDVRLQVVELVDRIPLSRPVLAHFLRRLADRLDEVDVEVNGATGR